MLRTDKKARAAGTLPSYIKRLTSQSSTTALRLGASLACLAGFSLVALADESAPPNVSPPAGILEISRPFPLPMAGVIDPEGMELSIQQMRGKIAVINFWATWCAPCVKEMPSLERLAKKLPTTDYAVVAISQDEGGYAVVRPFLEAHSISHLTNYFDPTGKASREFGIRGFPTTVIVSKDGTVISRLEGATEWDAEEIIQYLVQLSSR